MQKSLGDKYLTAVFWAYADKFGTGGFNFLVTIVLARLLVPEDFGLIAMVMIFYEISHTFVESGFTEALVRKQELTEEDKSTTFVFNFFVGLFLYGVLFFSAPFIAGFFNEPVLTLVVRLLGLNLIIESFAIIHGAVLLHEINFKALAQTRLAGIVISSLVAIGMAFHGYGVWSIVVKYNVASIVTTMVLMFMTKWKLSIRFSRDSFQQLFGFGSKIFFRALIDKFYRHIYNFIIGKYFTASMLGFYSQANQLKNTVILILFQTVHNVTYPVLSKLQDDYIRLKDSYRKLLKMNSFVIFPVLIVLIVLGKPIIVTLIGTKWLEAVPFFKLVCLATFTHHMIQINLNMLLIVNRPDLGLRLEIIQKLVITVAIVIGLQFGIYGLVISQVISSYIGLIVNTMYSKKLLNYGLLEQLNDALPSLAFALITGGFLFLMDQFLPYTGLLQLIISLPVAIFMYIGLHVMTHSEEMQLVSEIIIPKTLKLLRLSRS